MPIRMIFLPAIERRVTLGQYIKAVKAAKAQPDTEFKHGLTTWWPTTGEEIVRQFRKGMNERISDAHPYMKRNAI